MRVCGCTALGAAGAGAGSAPIRGCTALGTELEPDLCCFVAALRLLELAQLALRLFFSVDPWQHSAWRSWSRSQICAESQD